MVWLHLPCMRHVGNVKSSSLRVIPYARGSHIYLFIFSLTSSNIISLLFFDNYQILQKFLLYDPFFGFLFHTKMCRVLAVLSYIRWDPTKHLATSHQYCPKQFVVQCDIC